MQTIKDMWKSHSWLFLRIAQVMLLIILALAVIMLLSQPYEVDFDPVGLQSRIQTDANLASHIPESAPEQEPKAAYFNWGLSYSRAISAAIGGSRAKVRTHLGYLQQQTSTDERIQSLFQSLYMAVDAADKKSQIIYFRLLKKELQRMIDTSLQHNLHRFQLGIWLADMETMAVSGDKELFFRLQNLLKRQGEFLQVRFSKLDLAPLLNQIQQHPLQDSALYQIREYSRRLAEQAARLFKT